MLFTEPAFLFVFLPFTLAIYLAAPVSWRNAILTAASLCFYAVGEPRFVPFLLGSIVLGYVFGIWIERSRAIRGRSVLVLAIALDLALLVVFKYAAWFADNVDRALAALGIGHIAVPSILLPLGISFFTFHKISYEVDIYRGVTRAQRNLLTLSVYFLFFAQLVAGPIVRYHDIDSQLASRSVTVRRLADGTRRVIIGLAKKVIVANTVAIVADGIFKIPNGQLTTQLAWLGTFCYTLEIYFDFSGYSDMAIGLARMFGFDFLENFDHPYASRSITEFWRRWHISLSRFFRDYVYIPLGGSRRGASHTYRNLLIVFFLCGLWHGASWAFVAWGLYHGAFLVIERLGLSRWLERAPRAAVHVYTLGVVMFGWVFFRAGTFAKAMAFIRAMLGIRPPEQSSYASDLFMNRWIAVIMIVGAVTSFPIHKWITDWIARRDDDNRDRLWSLPAQLASTFGVFALLFVSLMLIAAGTYSPFLYSRF